MALNNSYSLTYLYFSKTIGQDGTKFGRKRSLVIYTCYTIFVSIGNSTWLLGSTMFWNWRKFWILFTERHVMKVLHGRYISFMTLYIDFDFLLIGNPLQAGQSFKHDIPCWKSSEYFFNLIESNLYINNHWKVLYKKKSCFLRVCGWVGYTRWHPKKDKFNIEH